MKSALVVGLGIGSLYKVVLEELGYKVDTVDIDSNKNPTYSDLKQIPATEYYDVCHICTPNFMHQSMAEFMIGKCNILFIEKPGVASAMDWAAMTTKAVRTKIVMVKNNQFRQNFDFLKSLYDQSEIVRFNWLNKNRIPHPGSWFTTKKHSFGGISRDLLPHLLSYYCEFDKDYAKSTVLFSSSHQNWLLENIESTDYGIVNKNGTHNVDDRCEILLKSANGKICQFVCDWKNDSHDDQSIEFISKSSYEKINLGLCPEQAYAKMIKTCVDNYSNKSFWKKQQTQDLWIHQFMDDVS